MIGKTVSHYRIVGPLGAGGMGVVYAGEDIRLGRPVALKFVPEELTRDRQAIERLNAEARTASGLNHPNICTVYDIGQYDGQPFIVMELLKGQTLRDRLTATPLKAVDVVEFGIQIADALDAAHRRDIIHRDIKPANLFLVDRGQVKILDFGLAKLVSSRTDALTTAGLTRDRTAEGVTLGTVSYMSPEQVTGEVLDARTDLFSLGVVLYEALTGRQPFTGKTSAMIFSEILTRAPVAPVVLNPVLPVRLQEVVNNCLEKDRELRYQDAAGLRADLKRVKRDLESGRSGVFRMSGPAGVGQEGQPGNAPTQVVTSAHNAGGESTMPHAPRAGSKMSYAAVAAAVAVATGLAAGGLFRIWPRASTPSATTDTAPAPALVRTQLALAAASIESRDYRAALAYADDTLRLAPDNREAVRIRDAARAMLTRFDNAVMQARERLAAGDRDGAAAAFNAARAIDPAAPAISELSTRLAGPFQTAPGVRREAPPSASAPATSPVPERPVTTESGRASAGRSRSAGEPTLVASLPAAAIPVAPAEPALPEAAAPAVPSASLRPDVSERRDPGAGPGIVENDDAAIRRVVATYARAIETKDLALFRTVKPNLSPDEQRRIEDGFRAVASQQVSVAVISIEQRGQDAVVQLKRRDTIRAGGRQQSTESQQAMTLTRAASGWVIRQIGR